MITIDTKFWVNNGNEGFMADNNETKQCPYCGEQININAKKCKYCKSWLVKEQEEYKRCPFCHKPIPKNAEKCSYCGEWLIDEPVNLSCSMGFDNRIVRVICWVWAVLGFVIIMALTESGGVVGFFAAIAFIILFIFLSYIYMYPSILALSKNHPQFVPILLINLIFGECVIGWIAALVWANTHRAGRHTHW